MTTDKPRLGLVDAAVSEDPFDLAKLRLDPEFFEGTSVKRLLTTVPVKKPGNQDFVRIHPSLEYRETLAFIELRDDREVYLITAAAANVPEIRAECFVATLFTAITRTNVLFLWPVRVPATDGRVNNWHASAATAVQFAMTKWVRIKANMALGAYEVFEAADTVPDPTWPEYSFDTLYRIAFKDRLIDSPDHPVIQRLLRG
jgi:hypothetical protein